jgi:hypothetical protein
MPLLMFHVLMHSIFYLLLFADVDRKAKESIFTEVDSRDLCWYVWIFTFDFEIMS